MMYDPDKAINELYEETETLKAELRAHRENEGDECPLCVLEKENDVLKELLIQREMVWGNFTRRVAEKAIDALLAGTQGSE